MASSYPCEPEVISREEYQIIFGDSDSEAEEVSDLEFSGLEDSDSESNTGEGDVEIGEDEVEPEAEVIDWSQQLSPVVLEEFDSPTGKTFDIAENASELDILSFIFTDEIVEKIVTESNKYARQKLALKPQQLENWVDTTASEMKAFLGVCIIMGLNSLPSIADYWSSDPFLGNEGIKQVMTKNRFECLSRFLHFNDSSLEPKRGKDNFDRLFKIRPILNYFNRKVQEA